jgi:magnesium chelatase family protein
MDHGRTDERHVGMRRVAQPVSQIALQRVTRPESKSVSEPETAPSKQPALNPQAQPSQQHAVYEAEDQRPVAATWSAAHAGRRATVVRVECALGRGFSGMVMIGNLGQVCDDGKERARAALERLGWSAPPQRHLISVSPADLKVDHSHLDLAFAVVLAGIQEAPQWEVDATQWLFAAEIGLDGELRPVTGVVAWAAAAMRQGLSGIVVAAENLREMRCLEAISGMGSSGFRVLGFRALKDTLAWLRGGGYEYLATPIDDHTAAIAMDFDDMDLGEDMATLALVCAAGPHSILMRGSPGTGKSMFARRLSSILPLMTQSEHLNALGVHSTAVARVDAAIIAGVPPFRAPHHFTSLAAIVGSGTGPGELALASGGVLFLDELTEFRRDVLEGLREPLEDGEVQISRAGGSRSWTARVILIAAANNCPCGWYGSKRRHCECPTTKLIAYRNRLSGPLLDRIDLHVNMEEPTNQVQALLAAPSKRMGQTDVLRRQVLTAREIAKSRESVTGVELNRDLPPSAVLAAFMIPKEEALSLIERVIPKHASARSLMRCLRVARTIADVRGRDAVQDGDLELAWSWQAWSAAKARGEVLPI